MTSIYCKISRNFFSAIGCKRHNFKVEKARLERALAILMNVIVISPFHEDFILVDYFDSRSRGYGLEPLRRRHWVVSLSKTLLSLLS